MVRNLKIKATTRIYRLNFPFEEPTRPGTLLEIVVIAYNEAAARRMCGAHCGLEGESPWLTRTRTMCTEVGAPIQEYRFPAVLCRYIQPPYEQKDWDERALKELSYENDRIPN